MKCVRTRAGKEKREVYRSALLLSMQIKKVNPIMDQGGSKRVVG